MTAGPGVRRTLEEERFAMLSIFFPMWNEEAYIHRAVRAAKGICEHLVADGEIGDYELIVVDDASTDATGRLADEMAAADAHIRVVHHAHNRKLGGSMKSGFAAARGDLVLYTDADLPFEMIELVRAVRVLRTYEADVVSAYRFDRTGEGPRRAVYSWVYNGLIHAMFGVRLRDINFAFKLCRRRVLDHVTLLSEGSFIDAELIIRAKRSGFEIVQIGVDYFPRSRGVSTLSSFGVIRTMLREMTALRRDLKSVTPMTAMTAVSAVTATTATTATSATTARAGEPPRPAEPATPDDSAVADRVEAMIPVALDEPSSSVAWVTSTGETRLSAGRT